MNIQKALKTIEREGFRAVKKGNDSRIKNTLEKQGLRLDSIDEQILRFLCLYKTATITQIQQVISIISRSGIYYRLLTLKGAGLVTSTRTARNKVQYSLIESVGGN